MSNVFIYKTFKEEHADCVELQKASAVHVIREQGEGEWYEIANN